jgi:hypothetical protein
MPRGTQIDPALLQAALEGLEHRLAETNEKIADVKKAAPNRCSCPRPCETAREEPSEEDDERRCPKADSGSSAETLGGVPCKVRPERAQSGGSRIGVVRLPGSTANILDIELEMIAPR